MKTLTRIVATALLACAAFAAQAADLTHLQTRWAEIHYQLPAQEQAAAYASLAAEAENLVQSDPDNAPALIWQGIILSSWAGAEGGLGALDKVKRARTVLERALEIDALALDGSAYTSLGALYYQVPGWPLAFGNRKQAEKLLLQALEINPDGIDSNYFWGDYLIQQKRYAEARAVLLKARAAPARPGRELADNGRQGEILQLLERL
jgi:tetratricopeptide (TPR) repeat protein